MHLEKNVWADGRLGVLKIKVFDDWMASRNI